MYSFIHFKRLNSLRALNISVDYLDYFLWISDILALLKVILFTNHLTVKFSFSGPENQELTAGQVLIMKQAMNKVKESVQRLAADHRDLHSTVSKVGKAIDRVKIITYFSKHFLDF